MSKSKTLEQIIIDLNKNKLSKVEANGLLISLIESSDNLDNRVKCMEVLGKIIIKNEENYKIVENYLISDENPLMRSVAAKILFYQFPKICINPLNWIIQNDKSILVLSTLFNLLKHSRKQIFERLEKTLQERISNIYEVNPKEADFLLEIESILSPNLEVGFFKPVKKNKHITALDFAGKKLIKLPSSIGALSHLEHLNLWDNSLTTIPDSIESLSALKYLYLDWNNFEKFPDIQWDKLKSLERLSYTNNTLMEEIPKSFFKLIRQNFADKYINEGVIFNEAPILGFLEVLTGIKLNKVKKKEKKFKLYACEYKLNADGNIVGIYLYGYHSFQINYIPKQLCFLKNLEELVLRDQNITKIPIYIKDLLALKHLDLRRNNVKFIPKSIKELEFLEFLDLGENKIRAIPEFIKDSGLNLWV
ncbi:MAG: leucine-rich repeat domain-containing protein [Candidatus Hodarchaeota archaeon]